MLSDNYKGNGEFQRANTNTHVFSKILFCGKCGLRINAGLDRARKYGYRPSIYTCYSSHYLDNTHNCNNFVSHIILMPFVLNYISTFINLQNKITQKHSIRDIERILLLGKSFVDVECVDRKKLEETYIAFAVGFDDKSYSNSGEEDFPENLELESLKKQKMKCEKALKRLEDLFLFSDEAMSNKDFLFKKRDLTQSLETVIEKLSELHRKSADMKLTTQSVKCNFFH